MSRIDGLREELGGAHPAAANFQIRFGQGERGLIRLHIEPMRF